MAEVTLSGTNIVTFYEYCKYFNTKISFQPIMINNIWGKAHDISASNASYHYISLSSYNHFCAALLIKEDAHIYYVQPSEGVVFR